MVKKVHLYKINIVTNDKSGNSPDSLCPTDKTGNLMLKNLVTLQRKCMGNLQTPKEAIINMEPENVTRRN